MRVAPLVELLVGVAHGLGFAAPQHDLEIDGLETVVLVAVDHAGGARDAFPWPQAGSDALAAFVFDKHVEITLKHEEALFHLVRMRGISLSPLPVHDRQGEVFRRADGWSAVLAGAARSDETVLRALIALDLGVLERCPVRPLLAEAPDVLLHDLLDRNIDQFRRAWMTCNAHGTLLSVGII